jgi:thiamine-monophosphate kinase
MKLSDIGEIELLSKYVIPNLQISHGDVNNDTVTFFRSNGSNLIWTIDPTPTPVAWLLGIKDPEILAWYTALINVSDILASGGKPLGLLVSIEMPSDMELEFCVRFVDGLRKACDELKISYLGGNVKSSSHLAVTASATGISRKEPLSRRFSRSEADIFVIGETGYFWAAVLANRYSISVPHKLELTLREKLCYPKPQFKASDLISSLPYSVACMDSSDGILNCCYQFAKLNKLDVALFQESWIIPNEVRRIYETCRIDPDTACYAFGEWQLVCGVPKNVSSEFQRCLGENAISFTHIGYSRGGSGNVESAKSHKLVNPLLLNQNFQSGFSDNRDIDSVISRFLLTPVFLS